MTYEIWRLHDHKPGCVDFLQEIDADNLTDAEEIARLMYPCEAGERLDIEAASDPP